MKLELDFTNKQIRIIGEVSVKDIQGQIKKLKLEDWSIVQGVEYTYYPIQTYPIYSDGTGNPQPYNYNVTCN